GTTAGGPGWLPGPRDLSAGGRARALQPRVDLVLVLLDPFRGLTRDLLWAVGALVHLGVLGVDVLDRDRDLPQQRSDSRVLLQELCVGDRPDVVRGEAQVARIRQAPGDTTQRGRVRELLLIFRQVGVWNLDPDDVFARL